MSAINPFMSYLIEDFHKNLSKHVLLDSDINKACFEIQSCPVDIKPKTFSRNQPFSYQQPQTLHIYPAKMDSENYLEKAEQLIEAIHGISSQVVFEISGNKKEIECSFYGEASDIIIIDSAVRNFYPKTITEKAEPEQIEGEFYVYDFIPEAPFYKTLTTYSGFIVSPLNLIPQLIFNIENNQIGIYQVLISPLPGEMHSLVEQAIDCEWNALQGDERRVMPSQQAGTIGRRLDYKVPDFRSYYSVCMRIIVPTNSLVSNIKAFISNYTYGSKNFQVFDNQHYSQAQICEMLNSRVSYHTGWLLNSLELTALLHVPYQVLDDKTYDEVFASAPVGDKPQKAVDYKDIPIGTWDCGSISKKVHLPTQIEIPHVHVLGLSRSGKSILLGRMAIEKFERQESVFVLDPHGDLITNILKMIPRDRMDDVVVIDFGLKDATPRITIRSNIDISNPSKASDDLTESMRDVSGSRENFWGPKMAYYFSCLFYIYSVLPDLSLTHIRLLVSRSKKAKVLRTKVKARIKHPIVQDFLDELDFIPYEAMTPVTNRLSHLLLDRKSLRLFTLKQNMISIVDIMENGKLCLINLSCGIIGRQRSSILSGLMDSLINNNALARANIPYQERKQCTVIKDEFYLGPGDLDNQLVGLAKYGLSVVFAHQYLDQVDGRTRDVMGTAGTRICFKLRREDAEVMGRDFGIDPAELTSLKKFQAIVKIEDEVIRVNTPKPAFNTDDCSEEIMNNCLEKYYKIHEEKHNEEEKPKLTYDTL